MNLYDCRSGDAGGGNDHGRTVGGDTAAGSGL